MPTFLNKVWKFLTSKWTLGIVALVVLIGGYWFFTHRGGTSYQFITVIQGSITQTVSVTGNTAPAQSVSLTFGSSGIISHTYSALGKQVSAGQVLAELNMSDLVAQLHEAQANVSAQLAQLQQTQANVSAQQAKLEGLQGGARPEDVAASQAALDKAKQDLANLYTGIIDTGTSGYAKAGDAVRSQLGTLFSNAETSQPQLTFQTGNSQAAINATSLRVSASQELDAWQQELAGISPSSSSDALAASLKTDLAHLAVIQNFLNTVSATLDGNINLSASQLAADRANLSVGLTEVNAAISSLNAISQNIASQKLTVSQLQAQLDLKRAGSLPTDISAQKAQVDQAQANVAGQQAQVEQAQASVESASAKIQNARILAPISGTVTQFDAKVGQLASPSVPLVSIMSSTGYEVDAGVSETDVGKITVGNKVSMTLDAFPNETFTGSVFYIAPAQTNTQGVISYQIKISFDKPDARLKSGLTANIDIQTKHDDNVLILPQYAILQNDTGTFVETLAGGTATTSPVTLGIQDQKGNVEVLSGVTAGEQVINIGLKTQ